MCWLQLKLLGAGSADCANCAKLLYDQTTLTSLGAREFCWWQRTRTKKGNDSGWKVGKQSPSSSIDFLSQMRSHRQIRKFALRNLKKMPDSELQNYLLQLVQAIKHETNHDSPLVRFLLRRAITNRLQIGQPFFWQLKVSTLNDVIALLCRVLV